MLVLIQARQQFTRELKRRLIVQLRPRVALLQAVAMASLLNNKSLELCPVQINKWAVANPFKIRL